MWVWSASVLAIFYSFRFKLSKWPNHVRYIVMLTKNNLFDYSSDFWVNLLLATLLLNWLVSSVLNLREMVNFCLYFLSALSSCLAVFCFLTYVMVFSILPRMSPEKSIKYRNVFWRFMASKCSWGIITCIGVFQMVILLPWSGVFVNGNVPKTFHSP